jgi:hypothetical protein
LDFTVRNASATALLKRRVTEQRYPLVRLMGDP